MPTRLSELLERIRPAGAPGPPMGEGAPRPSVEDELTAILDAVRDIEAEASQVVERGRAEAEGIGAEADRRIGQLRARLPDRVATARAEAERVGVRRLDADLARIRREAEQRVAELDRRAAEELPGLVDAAVGVIWTLLDEARGDGS